MKKLPGKRFPTESGFPGAPIKGLSSHGQGPGHVPPTSPDRSRVRPVFAAGCGDGSKPAETVVRGQILYRGEPVSGGLVVFAPDPDRGSDGPLVDGRPDRTTAPSP